VCGICYSACPVGAIEVAYYDHQSLLEYISQLQAKKHSNTLVLMCRGSSPATCEVQEILEQKGLNVKDYIPLRLPCVGRVPTELILRVLNLGFKNVVSIQCENGFCRFKEGTMVNTRRLALSQSLLEQLGFDRNALVIVNFSGKAVYETQKCVGCDKCTFVCPYDAIEVKPFATPEINLDRCVGCGACALVCPHLAIQLKGFKYELISRLILESGARAKKLKFDGVKPIILVFCCQWAEFPALDRMDPNSLPKNAILFEIPCFKGLDPAHVVEAFYAGFDGVLAVICDEKDCKLEKGKETAELNAAVLKETLIKFRLDDRFELCTTSPRCVGDFNLKLESFLRKVSSALEIKAGGH
jgi:coenzyme F420-reducing hydrogenase delta subunit